MKANVLTLQKSLYYEQAIFFSEDDGYLPHWRCIGVLWDGAGVLALLFWSSQSGCVTITMQVAVFLLSSEKFS